MRVVGAVVGGMLVLAAWVNIAATLIIPRGRVGFILLVDRAVDRLYRVAGRALRSYERRDTLLASQPALTLGALLLVWLAAFVVGWGLLLWPEVRSLGPALRQAGSSIFTLGFASARTAAPTVIDFLAAGSGLVVVALQIAYLPTLYSAYNRRETEVTLLSPRAGTPAWGPEVLARVQLSGNLEGLDLLYESWERWSADVAESHSSYPMLLRFRSPQPYASWVVSQLAVLDAAALHLAACPDSAPYTARLCLQMGFNCLRNLVRTLHVSVEEDPRPDDPVQLTWGEFLEGWTRMTEVGFPVERTAEEAWPHFRGWRVNYENPAFRLAYVVDAVPARWSGPRRTGSIVPVPRKFVNRTPDHPEGAPRVTKRGA